MLDCDILIVINIALNPLDNLAAAWGSKARCNPGGRAPAMR